MREWKYACKKYFEEFYLDGIREKVSLHIRTLMPYENTKSWIGRVNCDKQRKRTTNRWSYDKIRTLLYVTSYAEKIWDESSKHITKSSHGPHPKKNEEKTKNNKFKTEEIKQKNKNITGYMTSMTYNPCRMQRERGNTLDIIPIHKSSQICQCPRSGSPVRIIGWRKNHRYSLLDMRLPENPPFQQFKSCLGQCWQIFIRCFLQKAAIFLR